MARDRRVDVGWQHPETEEEFRVVCSVGPSQPEIRWGENAQPGYAGEVQILRVVEDKVGGVERPDLLELVAKSFDLLHDQAVEKAADDEEAAISGAEDRRYCFARDERRFGC